ncbi:MAG: tyrosine-type recombinase/integrase [Arcicella sp.]|nr:tyrosine-type recombinase/integrase [Arcicella sp.]
MSNLTKNEEKTNKVKLLKIPEVTCFLRNGTATIRLKLRGTDTKISLGVKAKQGCKIDPSTGQIEGDADATSVVLPMIERTKNALRQSFIWGKEPTLDSLKKEIFGISNIEQTPSLTVVLQNYFALYYGEKSEMDSKTKEKNGYSFRYIIAWLVVEFGSEIVELEHIKPIHAEKLLVYVMQTMNVSKEHARRTVGFLDRALKFAVKSGWLSANPFQYILEEKVFKRQKREIVNFLTINELEAIENAEIGNEELSKIRDWFVLSCHIGLDWHTFKGIKKSWILEDEDGNPYMDGNRCKPNGERLEPFTLPINNKANALICRFLSNSSPDSEFLFQHMPTNTHVNRLLKEVEILANVNRSISFNFGRKTFATVAINKGIRAEIIKQMMGHSKLDTTLSYYAKIDKKTVLKEGKF